jgi:hypothetical protein
LAPVTVAGQSTLDFSFAAVMNQLPLPLPFVSIRIQYSGLAASMVAELASVDQTQDLVIDSKLMNEGWTWSGSGGNPWHLDKQTESILFLTNESGQPARIGLQVTANNIHYYLTKLKLQPHETRVINLGSLRDAQAADCKNNKIPPGATDGAVNWVRIDNVPVTGRVVVVQRNGGVASNYDCCLCRCPLSFQSASAAPLPGFLSIGTALQMGDTGLYYGCNYAPYYIDITADAAWASSNEAVISVDTKTAGEVHGLAAGVSTINANYTGEHYTQGTNYQCDGSPLGSNPGSDGNVCGNHGCNDQRDCIIQQYDNYPIPPLEGGPFVPVCATFTNSAYTTNFTFAELNVQQEYPWAILTSTFLTGLQNTRNVYGPMTVNSGYREPAFNKAMGHVVGSRHVFGDAADIASTQSTWQTIANVADAQGACIEPTSQQNNSYAHVHMDWRGTCPSGWHW